MTTEIRIPGRTVNLDRLKPGTCYLAAGPAGPDLALVVIWEGRRGALLLNRRSGARGDLPVLSRLTSDVDVLELQGAVLVPSGAIGDIAFGRAEASPAALHLGDGRAYLCGRDGHGRLATFDVVSGVASAIDPADLPHARRWRVIVPEADGVVTVYESSGTD
ncbi:hypothetical protein SAMN05216360_101345 [Methylobacterium phyllostachyos]|uniref:Uncharacterized protein n=1 Tax=Methylobacterium phyllostachyos TaxID=582672 RepID=A0A1G9RRK6_9HYPH|nr:hypothetical protein [Methylobacterium phyllostachyos]SDM25607.1 hypothetical protein SAMN05216360_101345 [Methylobacterium phyllostachyos]